MKCSYEVSKESENFTKEVQHFQDRVREISQGKEASVILTGLIQATHDALFHEATDVENYSELLKMYIRSLKLFSLEGDCDD